MKKLSSVNRRLNIMHLVRCLDNGGLENTLTDVCNLLPPDKFSASLCVFEAGGAKEYRVDAKRVELVHVERHFGKDPTLPIRLARQLRRRRIDILHTNQWATHLPGLLAAKLARVPVLIHEEHGRLRDNRRQLLAQRWGWRQVDQLISVSHALADRMTSRIGIPRDQIRVISNGVDTDHFKLSKRLKSELRQELDLPVRGFLIGMVARFVPFKDHAGMLHVLKGLADMHIEANLVLAGDGPLREDLERLACQLDITERVYFLGEIRRVNLLLNALDVLVSNSSHNEGMSFTILEAMASGVPVVATRVAASPELLDEGNAGLLIPPRDTKALIEALRQLIGQPNLQQTLSHVGRQRVKKFYSIAAMVDSYNSLYLHLTGGSGRRWNDESTFSRLRTSGKCPSI